MYVVVGAEPPLGLYFLKRRRFRVLCVWTTTIGGRFVFLAEHYSTRNARAHTGPSARWSRMPRIDWGGGRPTDDDDDAWEGRGGLMRGWVREEGGEISSVACCIGWVGPKKEQGKKTECQPISPQHSTHIPYVYRLIFFFHSFLPCESF